MTNYDRRRAADGVPPVKKNWFARHKILSSIAGFFVFIALIAQCGEDSATVANPAPAETIVAVTETPAAPAPEIPTPTATPTGPSEAEQKAAEEKRRADAAAKKAAKEKKRKADAAKKKAAEDKKRKADAAKKKADAAKKKKAADEKKRKAAAAKKEAAEQRRREQENVYYANCDAVRAAGKAPIRRGQPGYRAGLDRDGDGQGCGAD